MNHSLVRATTRITLGLILLIALFFAAMQLLYANKIMPGVSVAGADLSGRTKQDAAKSLASRTKVADTITFTHDGRTYEVRGEDIALSVDSARSAERAYAESHRFGGIPSLLRSFAGKHEELALSVAYNQSVLKDKLTDQVKDVGTPVKNASVVNRDGDFRIIKEQAGTVVDYTASAALMQLALERGQRTSPLVVREGRPDILARDLTPARAYAETMSNRPLQVVAAGKTFRPEPSALPEWITFVPRKRDEATSPLDQNTLLADVAKYLTLESVTTGPVSPLTLYAVVNSEKVGQYVAQVAGEVDHPPVNARLSSANGQLAIAGQPQDGEVVDRAAAVKAVSQAMQDPARSARLPIVTKKAEIRQETLPALGLAHLIGSATTTFSGSPPNRTYNIGVGARRFDGVLIKPGEEFSFNGTLGDVGPETGYLPELVILEKRMERQYGGGLCQVSTTMFRAAMASGLPITDRTNHSYAVHYYAPIGMDATIYPPDPDMKFRNNTGGHILVQTRMAGQSLTYEFYGLSDGRRASSEVQHINATEEGGGTASFRYVVEGGPEPIDRVFYSSYKPRAAFPVSDSLD